MEKQKLIERIYNPLIKIEEINELFNIILKQQEQKKKEIQISIEFYQEEGPIKIKRCLYA